MAAMLLWHQHAEGQFRSDLSNLAVLVVCINHKAGNDEEMKKLDWKTYPQSSASLTPDN